MVQPFHATGIRVIESEIEAREKNGQGDIDLEIGKTKHIACQYFLLIVGGPQATIPHANTLPGTLGERDIPSFKFLALVF